MNFGQGKLSLGKSFRGETTSHFTSSSPIACLGRKCCLAKQDERSHIQRFLDIDVEHVYGPAI